MSVKFDLDVDEMDMGKAYLQAAQVVVTALAAKQSLTEAELKAYESALQYLQVTVEYAAPPIGTIVDDGDTVSEAA